MASADPPRCQIRLMRKFYAEHFGELSEETVEEGGHDVTWGFEK